MTYDFGGLARLIELLEARQDREEELAQSQLVEMLIEVARVWAHRELNPVSDSYGWEKFSTLFSDLHYADQGGAFGAWNLPHLDHEFWANPATLERRIGLYFAIKAKGGPAPKPAPQAQPVAAGGSNAYRPQAPRPQQSVAQGACPHGRTEVRITGDMKTDKDTGQQVPNPNAGKRFRVCLDCDKWLGWSRG
jgi:hypothetical protein